MIIPFSRIGLIVNNIVGDGPPENRSAMRIMSKHIVGEVIDKTFFFSKEQKKYLDLNQKIAFFHPKRQDI